nr:hypothetical protein CFP56_12247 [Quercus suber]
MRALVRSSGVHSVAANHVPLNSLRQPPSNLDCSLQRSISGLKNEESLSTQSRTAHAKDQCHRMRLPSDHARCHNVKTGFSEFRSASDPAPPKHNLP